MPDVNPNFTGNSVRQNGSWGHGVTAKTLTGSAAIPFISGAISSSTPGYGSNGAACATSSTAFCNSNAFMFGDAARSGIFGLRNPSVYNLNMSVRRSFNITPERVKFVLGVDCQNVTNKVTFSGIGTNVNTPSTFGTVSSATSNTGSRDFQFSGRVNF